MGHTGRVNRVALFVALLLLVASCGGGGDEGSAEPVASNDMCADVTKVEIAAESGGTYRFDVTVRSEETGWDKYADAWEVRGPNGSVLGTRILAHPHVDEQPFTRSLGQVEIPAGVTEVVVAARDLVEGFCGETKRVAVPNA